MTLFEFLNSSLVGGITVFLFAMLVVHMVVGSMIEWKESVEFQEFAKAQDMTDKERIASLEQQLAGMHAMYEAAKAKVPNLDKWRILATAEHIASEEYDGARYDTFDEALWLSCMASLQAVIRNKHKFDVEAYPIDGCE